MDYRIRNSARNEVARINNDEKSLFQKMTLSNGAEVYDFDLDEITNQLQNFLDSLSQPKTILSYAS